MRFANRPLPDGREMPLPPNSPIPLARCDAWSKRSETGLSSRRHGMSQPRLHVRGAPSKVWLSGMRPPRRHGLPGRINVPDHHETVETRLRKCAAVRGGMHAPAKIENDAAMRIGGCMSNPKRNTSGRPRLTHQMAHAAGVAWFNSSCGSTGAAVRASLVRSRGP